MKNAQIESLKPGSVPGFFLQGSDFLIEEVLEFLFGQESLDHFKDHALLFLIKLLDELHLLDSGQLAILVPFLDKRR